MRSQTLMKLFSILAGPQATEFVIMIAGISKVTRTIQANKNIIEHLGRLHESLLKGLKMIMANKRA